MNSVAYQSDFQTLITNLEVGYASFQPDASPGAYEIQEYFCIETNHMFCRMFDLLDQDLRGMRASQFFGYSHWKFFDWRKHFEQAHKECLEHWIEELSLRIKLVVFPINDQQRALLVYDVTDKKQSSEFSTQCQSNQGDNPCDTEAKDMLNARFLSNILNEIRKPLDSTESTVSKLLGSALIENQRENYEFLKRSVDSSLMIINDAIDFSMIKAGQLLLEVIDFDLLLCLKNILERFNTRDTKKKVSVHFIIDPQIPSKVQGDPTRLKQVLVNLLNNAVQFSTTGDILLKVDLHAESVDVLKNGLLKPIQLCFSIIDSRSSITCDEMALLSQPGIFSDVFLPMHGNRLYLGIAICKHIVEQMGGTLNLEVLEGKGLSCVFNAFFQVKPEDRMLQRNELVDLSDIRILCVVSNPVVLKIVSALLDTWHCRHEEAYDAISALERLNCAINSHDPFRVVIMDEMLQGTEGENLGLIIKEDPTLADTILMLMTSEPERSEKQRLSKVCFSTYLTKPVNKTLLHNALTMVLNQRRITQKKVEKVDPPGIKKPSLNEQIEKRTRILLVEDNETNQKVMLKLLEKFGYGADLAVNGKQAIQILEKNEYELILMDIQMPEMDGLKATKIIRDISSQVLNHDVPIVAVTAHAIKGDKDKCLAAGMNDYLTKPINPEKLLESLHKYLKTVSCKN